MTPETEFLRKLEAFLDQEFNDYIRNRIRGYLQDYKDQIPPLVIKKEEVIIKEVVKIKENPMIGKQNLSQDFLRKEAAAFCQNRGIDVKVFETNKSKKAPTDVVIARKEFCKSILSKYYCSSSTLAKFFNVHHSTIVFYLYGKKYFKKQKIQKIPQ
jgi:hypothetical protein